jgi:uncharacterized protein (TIRG00374 family)
MVCRADAVVTASVTAEERRPRRWARPVIGALVAAVILAIAFQKLDLDKLRAGLALLAPGHVLAVAALSLVHIGTRATRYHRLVLACQPSSYSWTDGVRIFLLGLSAAAVTPARAGDLVKARLVQPHGLGLGVGTGLVLVERVLDLVVMTVYALALSFVLPNDGLLAGSAALLAIVLGAVALCSSKRLQAIASRIAGPPAARLLGARYERVAGIVRGLLSTWTLVFRSPTRVLAFLGASFGIWFVEFLKLWVLLHLMGEPILLPVVVSAYATSLIAGAVSALPFSEGVVGVTLVAMLVSAGHVDSSTASIAVVVDRAASTLPPILLWVAFTLLRRSNAPSARSSS